MQRSKLRVFAGPNGSGKSTIFENYIKPNFRFGYYVNADEIEKVLRQDEKVNLADYGVQNFSEVKFKKLVQDHSITARIAQLGYPVQLRLADNSITVPHSQLFSYEAALIADLIRTELLDRKQDFSFETVLSHKSKIDFLKAAHEAGYRNYLYYVSTVAPAINVKRVQQRVEMGGHSVSKAKIESRYYKSLNLLREAIPYTYRTFIFDNTRSQTDLILEILEGKTIFYHHPTIPNWVDRYLLKKTDY